MFCEFYEKTGEFYIKLVAQVTLDFKRRNRSIFKTAKLLNLPTI